MKNSLVLDSFQLSIFHLLPTDIAIDIVDKKHCKAHHHCDIARLAECLHNPKPDKHKVVNAVCKGVEFTSFEC